MRPVLLVPELAFSRAVFDLAGAGLAPYLVAHGRDVFVLEPRGQGASERPHPLHLADLVTKDVPAALAAIAKVDRGPIDLVVHGYSGTLVLAAAAKEGLGRIGRVVALSTPAEPEVPNPLLETVLAHGGRLGELGLDPTEASAFEMLFCHHGLFGPGVVDLLRDAASDLDPTEASEWLTWLRNGDLPLGDGTSVTTRLAAYDRPTLLFLPLGDNLAHPEFAAPLRELAPRAHVQLHMLSKLELLAEDYSHLSMLQGRDAPQDVFAPALEFLDATPAAPLQAAGGEP